MSAAGPGGLLQSAKAVFDLLLVLRLGQFSLRNLNQLGRDSGLEEALNEVHEFSKVNKGTVHWDGQPGGVNSNTVHSTIATISNSASR